MGMPVAIPTDADGLAEILNDDEKLSKVMNSPKDFRDFIQNYQKTFTAADPGVNASVVEQCEAFMVNYLRNNTPAMDVDVKRLLNLDNANGSPIRSGGTVYNSDALGAQYDKLPFKNASEFFYKISNHAHKDVELSRQLAQLQNSMSSIKGSDGGFLIPEILRAELLQVALETAIVRPRARVIPMDSLTVPFPMVDSTSNVSSVYGGITGYWTEEGATLTESNPRFGRVTLNAHKLALYTEIPSELIQDSRPSMTALVDQMFPEAMAWFEDIGFSLGGGVGEPLGWMNADAMVQVDRTGSSSGTVVWTDVVNVYSRMLPQSLGRAVWVVAPDVFPALATMTVGNVPVWIGNSPSGGGASSPWGTLLGRPMIVSEKAKALGTAGDINFVDFGFYLVGDRQAMSARQSDDYKFKNDVTAFRVLERVDGRPWLPSAITPQNGSTNTLSPFVQLTTA